MMVVHAKKITVLIVIMSLVGFLGAQEVPTDSTPTPEVTTETPAGDMDVPAPDAEAVQEPVEEIASPSNEIEYNQYLKKADELKLLAEQSFESGDYDGATDYAAQAQEYVSLSDQFVEKLLKKSAASNSIAAADEKIAWAGGIKAETYYPEAWKLANTTIADAKSSFAAEEYDDAKIKADAVIAALGAIAEKPSLPSVYTVRLITGNRDCFWNISGYSFIYNDPTKWDKLYAANRSRLVNPQNPNLIHPGLKLTIPPLRNETRNGTFDPAKKYPSLDEIVPKAKKK